MTTIATLEFASPSLGRQSTCTVVLPEGDGPGPFGVLYLLHGQSDDHRAWIENSSLVRQLAAARAPLVVVLPDGAIGYWANVHPLMRYEDLLVDDLDALVRRTFPVRRGRAAIAGLSMGGYGALRLALRHPDRFAAARAHSIRAPARDELATLPWSRGVDPDELDLEAIAARARGGALPRIALDCGTEDRLLGDSRRVHALLDGLGVAHDYREHPGAHAWDYWDARLPETIAFAVDALAAEPE